MGNDTTNPPRASRRATPFRVIRRNALNAPGSNVIELIHRGHRFWNEDPEKREAARLWRVGGPQAPMCPNWLLATMSTAAG